MSMNREKVGLPHKYQLVVCKSVI